MFLQEYTIRLQPNGANGHLEITVGISKGLGVIVGYQLGLYRHVISLDIFGQVVETVSRKDKTIVHDEYSSDGGGIKPRPEEGTSCVGYCQTGLVGGAGNGFLGFGITKVERIPNTSIALYMTDKGIANLKIVLEGNTVIESSYDTVSGDSTDWD